MYTAYCHELEVATAGRTIQEAKTNLREAVEILFEECSRIGTLHDVLAEAGIAMNEDERGVSTSTRARFCQLEKLKLPFPAD